MNDWNKVFFRPWKGTNYGLRQFGRLLILGESHHGTNPSREWTIEVIQEYLANDVSQPWFRALTNIGLAVAGDAYWEMGRSEFWNAVAFYNYVQEAAAPGPRQAPTSEMFARSEPAFFEAISVLKPTHILALGFRLWEQMPPFESECPRLAIGKTRSECGRYEDIEGSHRALAIRIQHPSSGFSAKEWHPLICEFLRLRARFSFDTRDDCCHARRRQDFSARANLVDRVLEKRP